MPEHAGSITQLCDDRVVLEDDPKGFYEDLLAALDRVYRWNAVRRWMREQQEAAA